jgi:hypothetical protein
MLLIKASIGVYPYSLDDLRRDNPTYSIPDDLSGQNLSLWDAAEVLPTAPPTYDPAISILEEAAPELVDDIWYQRWSVRPLTQEELDAIVYPPNWKGFNFALFTNSDFVQYGISAQTVNPYLVPSIVERYGQITKLGLAESDFADYWTTFCTSLSVTVEHREQWASLAATYNLPIDFIDTIRGY